MALIRQRCPFDASKKDVDCVIAGEVPNRGWAMRSAPHAKIVAVPTLSSTLDDDVALTVEEEKNDND
jgi:hypothetical protein